MKTIETLKNMTTTINADEFATVIEQLAELEGKNHIRFFDRSEDIDLTAVISCCETDIRASIDGWDELTEDERENYGNFGQYHEISYSAGREWDVCYRSGEVAIIGE